MELEHSSEQLTDVSAQESQNKRRKRLFHQCCIPGTILETKISRGFPLVGFFSSINAKKSKSQEQKAAQNLWLHLTNKMFALLPQFSFIIDKASAKGLEAVEAKS